MSSTQWRLYISANNGGGDIAIAEMEMFAGSDTDQCTGGTATALRDYGGNYPASKAFDNFLNTLWYDNQFYLGYSWLQYEFPTAKDITGFSVRVRESGNNTPKDFKLQYYNGADWVDAFTVTNQTGWTASEKRSYGLQSLSVIGSGRGVGGYSGTIGYHSVAYSIIGTGGGVSGGDAIEYGRHPFYGIVGTGGGVSGGGASFGTVFGEMTRGYSIVGDGITVSGGSAILNLNGFFSIDVSSVTLNELFSAALGSIVIMNLSDLLAVIPTITNQISVYTPTVETISGSIPSISIADPPTAPALVLPEIPVVTVEGVEQITDFPIKPDITLSDITFVEPVLEEIPGGQTMPQLIIPEAPTFDNPVFPMRPDITLPVLDTSVSIDAIPIPDFTVDYTEPVFTSDALDTVETKLGLDIASGTGVTAEVEGSIWQREGDRSAGLAASVAGMIGLYLNQMPSLVESALLSDADYHAMGFMLAGSRQRIVSYGEAEQKNRAAARKATITLEDKLMTNISQIAEHGLKVAMLNGDAAQYVYDACVARYKAESTMYEAEAERRSEIIKAELEKLDVYRAQIAAINAQNAMNRARLATYEATISAGEQALKALEAEVRSKEIDAEIQMLKVELYKLKVEAYKAQVKIVEATARMKEMEVRGQIALVEVYKSQIAEQRQRIVEFTTKVEAKIITLKSAVEGFKTQTSVYESQVRILRADTEAQLTTFAAVNDLTMSLSDLNAASVIQAARAKTAGLGSYENQMIADRQTADAYIDRVRIAIQQIDSEGRINAQTIRATFAALTEALVVVYMKYKTTHGERHAETFETLDMSGRMTVMSFCDAMGIEPVKSGLPGQIAGF